MKESFYNLFFPYENKTVGFNGISQEFIILENELYELFQAAINNFEIEKLEDYHSDFYNYLVNKKFIVEKKINELEKVKKKIYEIDFDESLYELHINPTMNCNFKCWYCYETHKRGSKMSKEMIVKVNKLISNIITKNKKLKRFSINWFGGEPLLNFEDVIKPILSEAKKLCSKNQLIFMTLFTTNGMLLDSEKLKFLRNFNVYEFQITLDGNKERHDKVRYVSKSKGSYEKIVSNIKLAAKNGFRVSVRINYSKETMDGIKEIINDFLDIDQTIKKNLVFDFHKVWQEKVDLISERDEAIKLFKNNGFKISTQEIHTFDSTCYADKKNNANINYNGDVYKCTARDYTTESREGILNNKGVIEWNGKYHERLNSKFKNQPCLECKILPICKGGCSQLAIENRNREYCIYDYDEQKKLTFIKNYFANIFN